MKTTYTRTLFYEDLTKANIKLYLYKDSKYHAKQYDHDPIIIEYTDVKSWDIIEGGIDADIIESETDGSNYDELHTYLVLHFADGTQATFRYSHVDMFIE